LNKGSAETEAQKRAKALGNAVYADCRGRCVSAASLRFVTNVLATLEKHELVSARKYVTRGKQAFAETAKGFLVNLMLARDHPAAAGWVFRPTGYNHYIGSDISRSHLLEAIAGLEYLGLIERAPRFQRFGADVFESREMQFKGAATRFRSTFKLTAMAREAGVDLGALAEHFRPAVSRRGRPGAARRRS
jgi:hypothetical protein